MRGRGRGRGRMGCRGGLSGRRSPLGRRSLGRPSRILRGLGLGGD